MAMGDTIKDEAGWEQWRGYVVAAIAIFLLGAFCAWAIQWVPVEDQNNGYKDWRSSAEWVDF